MANKKMTIDEWKLKIKCEIEAVKKWGELYSEAIAMFDDAAADRAYKELHNAKHRRDYAKNRLTTLQRAAHLQQAPEYVGPWIAPDGETYDTVEDAEEAGHLAEDLAPVPLERSHIVLEAPKSPFRR